MPSPEKRKQKPTRARGRPRGRSQSANTRGEILHAAARLFSSKGIKATTMAEIAESVGIRTPAIYYYFRDREEILFELLTFVAESAAFADKIAGEEDKPSLVRLHAVISDQVQRLVNAEYDLWFVTSGVRRYASNDKKILGKAGSWRRSLKKLVVESAEAGEIAMEHSNMALAIITGMIHGAFIARDQGIKIDPDDIAGMCLLALGASPGSW